MGKSREIKNIIYTSVVLAFLGGCSGLEDSEKERIREMNATGEFIYRSHEDHDFEIPEPKRYVRENYPWEDSFIGKQIKITKEFFRCKGNSNNPPQTKQVNDEAIYTLDCGGSQQHSLPMHEGKEHIYPALIDLLNYIQEKTQKQVVITCGHRCPTHNTYSDASRFNQTSKHMVGAEVDFYVKGLEWSPERVVEVLMSYYQQHPDFKDVGVFCEFKRYENDTDVSTLPWFNKEIFIKVYKKDEGRDYDNRHRYPYISIQIKWDRDKKEPVTYSWSKAFNSYLRY